MPKRRKKTAKMGKRKNVLCKMYENQTKKTVKIEKTNSKITKVLIKQYKNVKITMQAKIYEKS